MSRAELAAARARRTRDREAVQRLAEDAPCCPCSGYDGSHYGSCPQLADSLRIVVATIRGRS